MSGLCFLSNDQLAAIVCADDSVLNLELAAQLGLPRAGLGNATAHPARRLLVVSADLDYLSRVRRALHRENEAGLVFIEPKTARARRTILLSRRAIAALCEHRRRQLARWSQLGPKWHDHDLVFCAADGRAPDPGWQRQIFSRPSKPKICP